MKELPILFSAQMVRAILDGRKTQTRRIVKPQPPKICEAVYAPYVAEKNLFVGLNEDAMQIWHGKSKFGQPGYRLWVRETWNHSNHPYGPADKDCIIFYRADYWDDPHGMDGEKSPEGKYREWRPSIHMPRWASRILLEITDVRVERLQEISERDAVAEGVCKYYCGTESDVKNPTRWGGEKPPLFDAPSDAYQHIWESINGPGSWDANPWVWVIGFKRVTQ